MRFVRRRIVKAGLAVALLVVGYVGFTFAQVWWSSRLDETRPAEAIIVMGAAQYDGTPSPVLRSRLDHAADLYEAGLADVIVVTGGRQEGDRFTEASSGARYLEERRGIPGAALRLESQGSNSWESLAAASRFLRDEAVDEVLVVSDPYHSHRLEAIASEVGLQAILSPTRTSPTRGFAKFQAMLRETAAVSIGRIIGYRRLMNVDESIRQTGGGDG